MDAVTAILHAHGYASVAAMPVGDYVEVDPASEAMMPLVIEKIGAHRLSVAHYYTQMGDRMADPEVVFHIDNGVWTPVRYVQHPYVERHDEDGLGIDGFVTQWNRQLHHQGYTDHGEVTPA